MLARCVNRGGFRRELFGVLPTQIFVAHTSSRYQGKPCTASDRYPGRVSFGLTFDKVLIILVIAVFLIGPERLPEYAAKFARLVRSIRDMANGAKERMREEMGPEFDEVDWQKLDPRQYDPRRIIRDALLEDTTAPVAAVAAPPRRSTATGYELRMRRLGKGAVPPFDDEAT